MPHSHFVFLVKEQGGIEERFADPGSFLADVEDIKERTGAIKAVINPSPQGAQEGNRLQQLRFEEDLTDVN